MNQIGLGWIGNCFGIFFAAMGKLPTGLMTLFYAITTRWKLLFFVPVLLILGIFAAHYFTVEMGDSSIKVDSVGPVKAVEQTIIYHYKDLKNIAEQCGDKLFYPQDFYRCIKSVPRPGS